jgi:hypothetical protein
VSSVCARYRLRGGKIPASARSPIPLLPAPQQLYHTHHIHSFHYLRFTVPCHSQYWIRALDNGYVGAKSLPPLVLVIITSYHLNGCIKPIIYTPFTTSGLPFPATVSIKCVRPIMATWGKIPTFARSPFALLLTPQQLYNTHCMDFLYHLRLPFPTTAGIDCVRLIMAHSGVKTPSRLRSRVLALTSPQPHPTSSLHDPRFVFTCPRQYQVHTLGICHLGQNTPMPLNLLILASHSLDSHIHSIPPTHPTSPARHLQWPGNTEHTRAVSVF